MALKNFCNINKHTCIFLNSNVPMKAYTPQNIFCDENTFFLNWLETHVANGT